MQSKKTVLQEYHRNVRNLRYSLLFYTKGVFFIFIFILLLHCLLRPGGSRQLRLKGVRVGFERASLEHIVLGSFRYFCMFSLRFQGGVFSFGNFRQKGGVCLVAFHLGIVLCVLRDDGFVGAGNALARLELLGGGGVRHLGLLGGTSILLLFPSFSCFQVQSSIFLFRGGATYITVGLRRNKKQGCPCFFYLIF